MSAQTTRTNSHSYPREELEAMKRFYDGKRCLITGLLNSVNWCHILDASLASSNQRLSEMLTRNLREDRHPTHAAEVRENLVPLNVHHHDSTDLHPPKVTLFLDEDVVVRTLAYERELQIWRIDELQAGRTDPGRPPYHEVFGDEQVTQHRYHCSNTFNSFVREGSNGSSTIYYVQDCPGIDDPTSHNNLPIINTLLSIPFSLLHNLPRLCAILPYTLYRQRLIMMSSEIIYLWGWDPSDEIKKSCDIQQRNLPGHDTRAPRPKPINHESRNHTTFITLPAFIVNTSTNPCSYNLNLAVEHHFGPVLPFTPTADWLTDRDEGVAKEDLPCVDMVGIIGSPITVETYTETCTNTLTESEDFGNTSNIVIIQDKSPICPSSLDIMSWSQHVVDSGPREPFLTDTSFERGVIASQSVNDILMIKGLIKPSIYIQFLDLSLFSRL